MKLAVQRVFSGLTFTAAHSMLRVPHDTSRWIVMQQDGHVVSFADTPAVTTTSMVLDITDRVVFRNVHGLLGLAFHPNFPTDPRAWVAYTHETAPGSGVIVMRVSEFTTTDNGATLESRLRTDRVRDGAARRPQQRWSPAVRTGWLSVLRRR